LLKSQLSIVALVLILLFIEESKEFCQQMQLIISTSATFM
jgi:hypothetical protein